MATVSREERLRGQWLAATIECPSCGSRNIVNQRVLPHVTACVWCHYPAYLNENLTFTEITEAHVAELDKPTRKELAKATKLHAEWQRQKKEAQRA